VVDAITRKCGNAKYALASFRIYASMLYRVNFCNYALVTQRRSALKIAEVDQLTVTFITDNYYDALRPAPEFVKRYSVTPGTSIHAEHGLSCYLEAVADGRARGFMFDYGLQSSGIIGNMDLLEIDVGMVTAFGLSHGHFDHWGGLLGFLIHNASKIQKGIPLYAGEEAFAHRYVTLPSDSEPRDIGRLKRDYIDRLGIVRVVEIKEPTEVIPGVYFTGNIERVTEYEQGSAALLIERDGNMEHDRFPGEQAVVCNVKGKGLVVLSGCAHAGIVNTVRHAQKMTGVEKVHAVIGGFHLVNAEPETIEMTLADLKEISPDHVIPAHCTGFEAAAFFAKEMPAQFTLNTAGTKYTFGK
jgi:7,8-dihydropterin-6-yl-methyl-4-(beta-D-ribofuranosyl)aminobenzene 5'-phosphate synthase